MGDNQKQIVIVSNYDNDRIAMYRSRFLVYQEHDLQNKKEAGLLENAHEVLALAGVPYDYREADPRWLNKRKKFPKSLDKVKFAN